MIRFDASQKGPLDGVRVLDLSRLVAGNMLTLYLADFGADVIKVEHPTKPDPARTHGLSKDGVGLWWPMLARNKRTLTLDLSHPEGQEIFLRLVAEADVVVENFRPGTLERIESALAKGGVVFTPADASGGVGVRLKK